MKKPTSDKIAGLSPTEDCEEIVRLLTYTLFPWDITKALEFALFRTYAVPSISKLLAATGEFTNRSQKRYDDTELILSEIAEHGIDSERGSKSVTRLNEMHGRFKIQNVDYLYVLSTFVFEPIRWMERYGARSFTELEKQAWFNRYVRLGRSMDIEDLPEDLASFEQFNIDFEEEHYAFAESNRIVGEATRDLFLGFYLPKSLAVLGRPFIYSFMDEPLLAAFRFPNPPMPVRSVASALMKARQLLVRALPENKKPQYTTQKKHPTYPLGYSIEELGTFSRSQSKSRPSKAGSEDSIS
jgi:hypothetical protein